MASITTSVSIPPPACGLPFDSYGNIKFEDEQARLDNFAIQVTYEPESTGLILTSAGKKTFKGEAAYRLGRAKSYLVNFRRIDSRRIITLDCGFTQELSTRLLIVPHGATVPECDSASQIPLSEVMFTKRRPKSSKKHR